MRSLLPSSLALFVLLSSACSRSARVAPNTGPALPAGVSMALVTRGDSIFNAGSCQRCHGAKGVGAQNGPSLVAGPWLHHTGAYDEIVSTITSGVPREKLKDTTRRFAMGARGGQQMNLNDEQVRAVAAYVWTISRDKR
jgi:mono/diheme cytochrome c family protein